MRLELMIKVIEVVPSIMWIVFVATVFVALRRQIVMLVPHLSHAKALGIELSFAEATLKDAIEDRGVKVSANDERGVLARAQAHSKILDRLRILWVDDHPENNRDERRLFQSLGMQVDVARSTEEALDLLRRSDYDVLITDMVRENDPRAGLTLIEDARQAHVAIWTILYVGSVRELGVPAGAFGITDRPDHLLHYVIDIAERERI